MPLRTLLLAAGCLQHLRAQTVDGQNNQAAWNDAAPGVAASGELVTAPPVGDGKKSCQATAPLIRRFTLRRPFWGHTMGLFNKVVVQDRKGKEVLMAHSRLPWDDVKWNEPATWLNLVKFDGADLYVNKNDAEARGKGFEGYFDKTYAAGDLEFIGRSYGDMFNFTLQDCDGEIVTVVQGNQLFFGFPNFSSQESVDEKKGGFFAYKSGLGAPSNELIIFDLEQPTPKPMAKFEERQKCMLFPPFCTQIPTPWYQPFVGRVWLGDVEQKNYGQSIGPKTNDFKMSYGANSAIDLKFLALYSIHVFGASMFSYGAWVVSTTLLFILTFFCCWKCCCRPSPPPAHEDEEEPIFASSIRGQNGKLESAYSSPWHCCSRQRKQEQYNASLSTMKLSQLVSEAKNKGASQREINNLLDSENPQGSITNVLGSGKSFRTKALE